MSVVDKTLPAGATPPPPTSQRPPKPWHRRVFLSVSGVVVLATVLWAQAVILPFVLAIVIAYVLTPAVMWVERKRVPRALAIIVIYTLLIGSIVVSIRFIAPKIGDELKTLHDEIPALAKEAKEKWIPSLTAKLKELGISPVEAPPPAADVEAPPPGALLVKPQPDGSYAIDVGTGIAIKQTKHGYVVEPVRSPAAMKDEAFDPTRLVADALGKSFVYARENSVEIAKIGRDILAGISKFIFLFFITLMLAAYIMMTHEKVFAFFESLIRPSSRSSFRVLLRRIDRGLGGVIRGQLIICLINGILSAIGFAIVGLKYWPVLALVAAVLSLIPIFGAIISSIPAVAVGLTQGIGTAAFVLVWIIGIHQIEANFLNPKIMGDAAKIHPVLVVFSLLVGEHFFGATGALLAVPVFSLAKSLFLHFRDIAHKGDPELATEVVPESR